MILVFINFEINICIFDYDYFWFGVIYFCEKNYLIGFILVLKYFYCIFLFWKNNLYKWGINIFYIYLEIVLKLDVVGYFFNGKWLKIFLGFLRNYIVIRDDCDKFCFLILFVKIVFIFY